MGIRGKGGFALALGLLALSSSPAGSAIPEAGTETSPELSDASGDVRYGPTHQGGAHKYVDLLALWFDHEPANDTIVLTLKTEDASDLFRAADNNMVTCSGSGNSTRDGQPTGNFRFSWTKSVGADKLTASWAWQERQTNPSGSGPSNSRRLEHTFHANMSAPAYFVWTAQRNAVLAYAETIRSLNVTCFEFVRLAGAVPTDENEDRGASVAEYSFKDLRRLRTGDGSEEPWEKATASSQPVVTSDEEPSGTPGMAVIVAICALAATAAIRRSR